MNSNLTELIFILDKSGSMTDKKADVIGGFNSFLEKQKIIPGEMNTTIVFFDSYGNNILYADRIPISNIKLLDDKSYTPCGMTALLDAIGQTITSIGKKLLEEAEEKRPSKVLMVIMTDGEENDSREYRKEQIKNMLEHQQNVYKWEIQFLGANIDSFGEAGKIGIARNVASYQQSSVAYAATFNNLADATTQFRSGKPYALNTTGMDKKD